MEKVVGGDVDLERDCILIVWLGNASTVNSFLKEEKGILSLFLIVEKVRERPFLSFYNHR